MSDERFEQLGIPRRRFLKASAAAAFAAPVVVSFGLDGIAEAHGHGQSMANMSCANMTISNPVAEHDLVELIGLLVMAVQTGQIGHGLGNSLSQKALEAALQLASGHSRGACAKLDSLVAQLGRHSATSGTMRSLAESAWANAGCACFPSHHD